MNKIQAQKMQNPNKDGNPGSREYFLGESFGGGKIFWLDETGQHGLVAASADQSAKGIAWNPGKVLCLDFTFSANNVEYKDWYLPSKYELNLLYQQKNVIGGFNTTSGIYWSSTESSLSPETQAWEQEFKFGSQLEDDKDQHDQVRCIRKF